MWKATKRHVVTVYGQETWNVIDEDNEGNWTRLLVVPEGFSQCTKPLQEELVKSIVDLLNQHDYANMVK